jgi:hypothetical protein
MENTATAGSVGNTRPHDQDERLVKTDRFLAELSNYARAVSAPRGSTCFLRPKLREAARAGTIPRVRIGQGFGFKLSDVEVVARALGIVPHADEPEGAS